MSVRPFADKNQEMWVDAWADDGYGIAVALGQDMAPGQPQRCAVVHGWAHLDAETCRQYARHLLQLADQFAAKGE